MLYQPVSAEPTVLVQIVDRKACHGTMECMYIAQLHDIALSAADVLSHMHDCIEVVLT